MTTEDRYAVLSALIDREPVDPDDVGAALEEREGRELLVSFARLRAAVSHEVDAEATAVPRLPSSPESRWAGTWRLAAAILLPLLMGLGGGYWWRQHEANQPPTPTQVARFVPGVDWHAGVK